MGFLSLIVFNKDILVIHKINNSITKSLSLTGHNHRGGFANLAAENEDLPRSLCSGGNSPGSPRPLRVRIEPRDRRPRSPRSTVSLGDYELNSICFWISLVFGSKDHAVRV